MTDTLHQLTLEIASNPWLAAYIAGVLTGWHAARRSTRYMLGGRL
jgi:hypothetical protein